MASWSKPVEDYCKINVKGIFNRHAMKASVGCVIRDSSGDWVCGCGGMIGLAVPLHAQLWGIYYGIKHAWEHNISSVVVEYDFAEAVAMVLENDPDDPMTYLLHLINDLMGEDWDDMQLVDISEDANQEALTLANICLAGEGE